MPYITANTANRPTKLFYEDWGDGKPVVLIHGWPLDRGMWEYQMLNLTQNGMRCIAYDRRGFGKSDKPYHGYHYDVFAEDLKELLEVLDLTDVTLVGFSMGGGEVIRYLSTFGSSRVSKAVLISSVTPLLIKSAENPEGVAIEQFEEMIVQIAQDRPRFMASFAKQLYGEGWIVSNVSQEILNWTGQLALRASPKATIDCIRTFSQTDFRAELPTIDIPVLVMHGDSDKTVPFDTTGKIAAQLLPLSKLKVIERAPHGLFFTHKEIVNAELFSFIEP